MNQLQNTFVTGDFDGPASFQTKNIPYTTLKAFPLDGDGGGAGYGEDNGDGATTGYGKSRKQMWNDQISKYKLWQQLQNQGWINPSSLPAPTPYLTYPTTTTCTGPF